MVFFFNCILFFPLSIICFLCSFFSSVFVLSVLFFWILFVFLPSFLSMIKIQAVPSYLLIPCAFTVVINSQYLSANFVLFRNLMFLDVLGPRFRLFHGPFPEF